MYNGLLHLHSGLRWVVLLLLLIAIYRSFSGSKKPFTSTDKNVGLWLMIVTDIMLLAGLYLWFFNERGLGYKSIEQAGFSNVMKDPLARFFAVEHTIGMLIAIVFIHIGKSYAKKSITDAVKHKRTLLFYGLALLIILISIPWPFRAIFSGRGWF